MRVLMLGWEFPPYISGGLGTACYGLTRALSRQHTHITFVLPRPVGDEDATHVRLRSPQTTPPGSAPGTAAIPGTAPGGHAAPAEIAAAPGTPETPGFPETSETPASSAAEEEAAAAITFRTVPALFASPYGSGGPVGFDPTFGTVGIGTTRPTFPAGPSPARTASGDAPHRVPGVFTSPEHPGHPGYEGDLIAQAHHYADWCVQIARDETFDVIHVHDWLTFPAGMAVARATGRPLVVHVHSTEFDRSGEHIDTRIYDLERQGVHAADRVIAVSHLTRRVLEGRYGVPADRISVVYNGIQNGAPGAGLAWDATDRAMIQKADKIVLFLGRITMQKGPEYFVAAAKKVLARFDKVKFVMAGTGDKVADVIELAAREGIGHKVLFTGFLRPQDVERVFQMADVYVMPSVSEPFGISALEAISHDVPVIISRQSGVSEVIRHALKVDFWDVDEIANKVLAVLRHPPLGATLREHADLEVRRLTWDDAATKTLQVYEQVLR